MRDDDARACKWPSVKDVPPRGATVARLLLGNFGPAVGGDLQGVRGGNFETWKNKLLRQF